MTLATSTGTWGPANDGHYVIGPEKAVENTKLYLTLDGDLNVTDLQSTPTEAKAITGLTGNIKFPALLPSGQAPDEALPAGTTMTTEITAVNTAGADIKESNAVTPIESIGPQATMHGLRFDSARGTVLQRTPNDGNRTTATWSFWFKKTADGANDTFFGAGSDSNSDAQIYINGANKLYCFFRLTGTTQITYQSSQAFTSNGKWQHFVVTVDTTQSTSLKAYVDGVEITGWDVSTDAPLNSQLIINNPDHVNYIGRGRGNAGVDLDSYLSDYFYVDGQALPASAFGAEFEGKWGPLDSSVVKTNIGDFGANGFFLPFDPAADW